MAFVMYYDVGVGHNRSLVGEEEGDGGQVWTNGKVLVETSFDRGGMGPLRGVAK